MSGTVLGIGNIEKTYISQHYMTSFSVKYKKNTQQFSRMMTVTQGREPLKILLLDGLFLSSEILGHIVLTEQLAQNLVFSIPLVYWLVSQMLCSLQQGLPLPLPQLLAQHLTQEVPLMDDLNLLLFKRVLETCPWQESILTTLMLDILLKVAT